MFPHEAPVTADALVPWEALTAAVSELDVIRVQLKEALARERAARFYDLLRLKRVIGQEHAETIGTVIELTEGHSCVHWPREGGFAYFPSSVSMRSGLHVGHESLLSLVDVSERRATVATRRQGMHDELTGRERGVLFELSRGLSNLQIGDRLGLSEQTVKNILSGNHGPGIYRKLNVQGRHARVRAALVAHDLDLTSADGSMR